MITRAKDSRGARRLAAKEVDLVVDETRLGFRTTAELEPLDEIVGQPRALEALDLGLGIDHPSYNIYVAGLSGMGKKDMIHRALTERVGRVPTPPDWVYLNNFDEPDRPLAVALEPGQGLGLKRDMDRLIERLAEDLPTAFHQEDLGHQKQRLNHQFQEKLRALSGELEETVREYDLAIQEIPGGQVALVPLRENAPLSPQQIDDLSDAQRDDIRRRQKEAAQHVTRYLARQQEVSRELRAALEQLERDFAARLIEPLVEEVARRHVRPQDEASGAALRAEAPEGAGIRAAAEPAFPRLRGWFDRLKEHMLDHLDRFQDREEGQAAQVAGMLGLSFPEPEERFREYRVNVLVDNGGVQGAPVIVEDSPNYKNLFGIIDRTVDQVGHSTTDFTRVKAGSLLRANGGYLVFNLLDALIEPVVWKELKRTIKSGCLQIELYEPLGLFSISPLKPEPIPLRVKLVAMGNPLVYHLLHLLDEDFAEIFRVKAEFRPDMARPEDAGRVVGRLLQKLRRDGEDLLPFQADGVAELVRAGARLVNDRRKLTAEFSRLADLAREASYWAVREQASAVARSHVRRAMAAKIYRSDLIAARIREMIQDGVLRVSLEGGVVGQVNGLAVADLGDYAFGRPARVTAGVGVGAAGIVNVERESKLSGNTYDKGMLILEGYLRNRYAGHAPLALSASLAMEQSYGLIDGDSASAAELLCLLSALAELPLRQDVAVTGSVNQWGEIQAVGGVNEKVEGFFDVCREHGLTGTQGVAVPASNARHLVLRPEVVKKVAAGEFHVWTVDHVDDVLELLTGVPAGAPDDAETVHGRAAARLRELAAHLKEQQAPLGARLSPPPAFAEPARDPRPPLPGRNR